MKDDFTSHMLLQKQIIRETVATLKKSFSYETIAEKSRLICNRLVQTDLFQKATCIAIYCSTKKEVQTLQLIEEWRYRKHFVLPVISGEYMHFFSEGTITPPEEIDLFVVPGIAFDYACIRLGRGKGYYDRYLSNTNKPTIGLSFDFQLFESMPYEQHDKKMTLVITETVIVSSHHQ